MGREYWNDTEMDVCAIDITAEQRKTVLALLARHLPNTTAWVYGSRVKWTARPESDLDLVVFATPEQARRVSDLREAFEESNLPFRMDLFVWDTVPEQFRKTIEAEHVVLVEREERGVGDEWPIMPLREAGVSLIDCEHRTPPAAERGYPYVAIPQVKDGRINLNGVRRITRERFDEWTRKADPKSFDIVLSRRCNPGETGFVSEGLKFALGQNLVLLRSDGTKVFKPFLRWLVRGPRWWDQVGVYINVGAVFDSLKCGDIPGFRLPIPPLPKQRAIAHVLGTLDDKIELNRRMSQTLEAMARALFKSWFVDFDPVRAKATLKYRDTTPPHGESDWSVERARAYLDRMDPDIAALFPDSFVDSEHGPIPEGWEVKPLDEIAVFQNGLALQRYRPQENEEWLPVVKIAQLRSGKADSGEKATAKIRPECVIEDGDVVFSWSGSLMVKVWCGGRAALNQHLFKVASTKFPKWFFLLCVHSHLGDFRTIAAGKATTMGHIKRHHLSEAMCAVPNGQLLSAANGLMTALLEKSISASIQSRTLATLRDALLPKMVSGELCVGVGHHFIGDIVTGLNSPPK